jgi:hypothetical protein
MPRDKSTIRQRVTAAVKGTRAAGFDVARVEIDSCDRIVVITEKAAVLTTAQSDLDSELAEFEASHGKD